MAPTGLFFALPVAPEPPTKRVVSFFDGQNLFWHAKAAFGYLHPNYDPNLLSVAVCRENGWQCHGVRIRMNQAFYDACLDPRDYWQ